MKLVLIGLCERAHDDYPVAWPSVSTLSRYSCSSPRTVQRSLRTLVDEKFIEPCDNPPPRFYDARPDHRPTPYIVKVERLRGDTVTPREAPRGDMGDANGVTPMTPRGDTDVTRTVSEPLEEPSSSPATPDGVQAEGWEQARELAEYLADAIVESGGEDTKRPNVTRTWIADMERLVRLDGRPPDKVRAAIDWVHRDPDGAFWSANILSPGKLRSQYEQLRRRAIQAREQAKAKTDGERAGPTTPRRVVGETDEEAARAERERLFRELTGDKETA